jgi:uncharacterized protein
MKRPALLGLLLLWSACAHAQALAPLQAPAAAERAQERALPVLTGRVMDEAGIISASAEARLSARLADLERRTGDQLVIVTTPDLGGEAIGDLGLRLGNGWGVGQAGLNNGVLLIVAPQDRQVRIEVGYGLEGLLTDARAAQIIDQVMIPRFQNGAYEDAVTEGAERIAAILLADRYRPRPLVDR